MQSSEGKSINCLARSSPLMSDNVVLVTGCSSGIGHASARSFHEAGWTVYATAPTTESLTDLSNLGCRTASLNVTETTEVENVIDRIEREQGHLDCLVNNAGFGQLGAVEDIPPDAMREQFDVNVFGPHRLIHAGLPLMRKSETGTIINISSIYGRFTMPGQGAYCSSKFALEGLSHTLRTELSGSKTNVVLIEPGPVETNFGKTALDSKDNLHATGGQEWFYRLYRTRRVIDKAPGYVQPERVAEVICNAAMDEDPKPRYVVGPYKPLVPIAELFPSWIRDKGFALARRALDGFDSISSQ